VNIKAAGNFNMEDKSEKRMENIDDINVNDQGQKKRLSGVKLFFLVIVVAVVTSVLTVWLSALYFFPKQFKPVELSKSESQVLADKLDRLAPTARSKTVPADKGGKTLTPGKYSEDAASRKY
jgi:hypothetical protein